MTAEANKGTDIIHRSMSSVGWNIVVSIVQVVVGFVRATLLSRFLSVETFGVYGFAGSIIGLSVVVANFGLAGAFIHRDPETEDEEKAASIFFTLRIVLASIWVVVLLGFAYLFTGGQDRLALVILVLIRGAISLVQAPRMILIRRVVHRRLALLQLVNILLSAIFAVFLAWQDAGLWALVSTDIITLVVSFFFLYVWRPVWRPRLSWSPTTVRYFLRFGSRNLLASVLLRALDRVDDLWTGAYLGRNSLGFYSRAYTFATYPRSILAESISKVAGGTYAELKEDRRRLSQAFFRINAFLVRTGFLMAGLLALIAPEFICLILGAKWLPMLDAFRLMLIFTLLDPIKLTVGDLFIAVGKPEQIVRARIVQLVILMAGLFVLGPSWDIAGVALAVDFMLLVGMTLLLWQSRCYVDFSVRRLFITPGIGLFCGLLLAQGASNLPGVTGSDWRTGFVKVVVFSVIYGLFLFIVERKQVIDIVSFLTKRYFVKRMPH